MTSEEQQAWSQGEEPAPDAPLNEEIEIIAPPLVASGTVSLGRFSRLSDFVNLEPGFLVLSDAQVRSPRSPHLEGRLESLVIDKQRVAILGQRAGGHRGDASAVIAKVRRTLTAILPGLVVSGQVFLHRDAALDAFLESRDPRFIPMADIEVLSASGGPPIAQYAFALLQRSMVIAAPAISDTSGDAAPEIETLPSG